MFTLSGFGDEIGDELEVQLDTLTELDIHFLELRGVWGKNVLELTDEEAQIVKTELGRRDMGVSAIGSPIGKVGIDDPIEPELARLRRATELAAFFHCRYVRLFSYLVPEGQEDAHGDQVIERMRALVDAVKGRPVILLHENERPIYGDIPRRCHNIHTAIDSPQLRMTFDPANFVLCDVRPFSDGWDLLKDHISYVHIKDATMSDQRVVPAGQGDGQLRELLHALDARGYDGFLSIEPHLSFAGEFGGYSGPELFGDATRALRGLLAELGSRVV